LLRPGVLVALCVLGVIAAGVYVMLARPFARHAEVILRDNAIVRPAQQEAAPPVQSGRAQTAQSDLAVAGADVHAVGVYEGTVPAHSERPKGGHPLGTVDVTVAVRDRPIILILTAYNPVHWRIGIAPGVQVMQVFTQGYYAPMVSGVPENVPVVSRSYEVDRSWFRLSGPRPDEVLAFSDQVRAATGSGVQTVQYAYRGQGFSVDGVSSLPLPGAAASLGAPAQSARGPGALGAYRESAERTLTADHPTATYCCAGAFSLVTADRAYTAGKHYAEFTLHVRPGATTSDLYTNAGIVSQLARGFGPNAAGAYAYPVISLNTPGRLRDGDVVGIDMDLDTARLYYHVNGAWMAGPPPQAGVAIAPRRAYRAAVTVSAPPVQTPASDTWTANVGQAPFAFPAPDAFQPYGGPAGGG